MLAYHAIYRLLQSGSHKCYSLKLSSLTKKDPDSIKDILNELDTLPTNFGYLSRKLILIDDAHRLSFASELEQKFREEAEQGNGQFIWIILILTLTRS